MGGVCVCGFTAPPEEGWGCLWGEGSPWPHLPAEEEEMAFRDQRVTHQGHVSTGPRGLRVSRPPGAGSPAG